MQIKSNPYIITHRVKTSSSCWFYEIFIDMSKRHTNKKFFFDRFLRSTSGILDSVSPLSWFLLLCNYIYNHSLSIFTKKSHNYFSGNIHPSRSHTFNTRQNTQLNKLVECFCLAGIKNQSNQKLIINKLRLLPKIHANFWLNTFFSVATSMKKNDATLCRMINVLRKDSNKQIFDYINSVNVTLSSEYSQGLSDNFDSTEMLIQLKFINNSKPSQNKPFFKECKPLIFSI